MASARFWDWGAKKKILPSLSLPLSPPSLFLFFFFSSPPFLVFILFPFLFPFSLPLYRSMLVPTPLFVTHLSE